MNGTAPPPMPASPIKKSGMPTWGIVLLVIGAAGIPVIVIIGLLAAIAIPNFVKARETAQKNVCINNLRMIDAAKQQWSLENKQDATNAPTQSQIMVYFPNRPFPICPAGGTYTINTVGEDPACTIPNHRLPSSPPVPNH